jgi:hypothetical protein
MRFDATAQRAVVTFNNVPNYGGGGSATFQWQFWANGTVHVIYQAVTGSPSTLVGYSPGGGATDPGAIDISAALAAGLPALASREALLAQQLEPGNPSALKLRSDATEATHSVRRAQAQQGSAFAAALYLLVFRLRAEEGLAALLLRWFPPNNWGDFLRWGAVMFSHGMCMSVRHSLVDGPSLLLVAVAMAALEQGRRDCPGVPAAG